MTKSAAERVNVVLYGKSVDVTGWLKTHPGGAKVLHLFKDRDATEQFEAYHSPEAVAMMNKRLACAPAAPPADVPDRTRELREDFAAMVAEAKARGLFHAKPLDEIVKISSIVAIWIAGAILLRTGSGWPMWLGLVLFTFAVQQCGWLAHDYSHHQPLPWPAMCDLVGRFVGVLQTYELGWWKARHNTHHVLTNEVGVDPDIKTSPLFTYLHAKAVTAVPALNALQRFQHIYFLPALCLLHVYWVYESFMYLFTRFRSSLLLMAVFLTGLALQAWIFANAGVGVWALFAAAKGFTTGIVVFATHYAEDRLQPTHGLSLVEQSVVASRNISGSFPVRVFCGGINYQIEHHLCPMMPRGNLGEFSGMVRAFCAKHKLGYRESPLWGCLVLNMKRLDAATAFDFD